MARPGEKRSSVVGRHAAPDVEGQIPLFLNGDQHVLDAVLVADRLDAHPREDAQLVERPSNPGQFFRRDGIAGMHVHGAPNRLPARSRVSGDLHRPREDDGTGNHGDDDNGALPGGVQARLHLGIGVKETLLPVGLDHAPRPLGQRVGVERPPHQVREEHPTDDTRRAPAHIDADHRRAGAGCHPVGDVHFAALADGPRSRRPPAPRDGDARIALRPVEFLDGLCRSVGRLGRDGLAGKRRCVQLLRRRLRRGLTEEPLGAPARGRHGGGLAAGARLRETPGKAPAAGHADHIRVDRFTLHAGAAQRVAGAPFAIEPKAHRSLGLDHRHLDRRLEPTCGLGLRRKATAGLVGKVTAEAGSVIQRHRRDQLGFIRQPRPIHRVGVADGPGAAGLDEHRKPFATLRMGRKLEVDPGLGPPRAAPPQEGARPRVEPFGQRVLCGAERGIGPWFPDRHSLACQDAACLGLGQRVVRPDLHFPDQLRRPLDDRNGHEGVPFVVPTALEPRVGRRPAPEAVGRLDQPLPAKRFVPIPRLTLCKPDGPQQITNRKRTYAYDGQPGDPRRRPDAVLDLDAFYFLAVRQLDRPWLHPGLYLPELAGAKNSRDILAHIHWQEERALPHAEQGVEGFATQTAAGGGDRHIRDEASGPMLEVCRPSLRGMRIGGRGCPVRLPRQRQTKEERDQSSSHRYLSSAPKAAPRSSVRPSSWLVE